MISKIVDFFKSWSKVIIGLLGLLFFFIIMKKLGISMSSLLQIVRNFIKPKATPENPENAIKVSESRQVDEVKIEEMQAQKVSDKAINEIDRILDEIGKNK